MQSNTITVPDAHRAYSASYRHGYAQGLEHEVARKPEDFLNVAAWAAYQAGYIAGRRSPGRKAKTSAKPRDTDSHTLFPESDNEKEIS